MIAARTRVSSPKAFRESLRTGPAMMILQERQLYRNPDPPLGLCTMGMVFDCAAPPILCSLTRDVQRWRLVLPTQLHPFLRP